MEQMSIFDFIEKEYKTVYGPVIEDLANELNSIFSNRKHKEAYTIWDHVKALGYRFEYWVSVNSEEFVSLVEQLHKLKQKYMAEFLEVSILQLPDFHDVNSMQLFISTLWRDKNRAKRG